MTKRAERGAFCLAFLARDEHVEFAERLARARMRARMRVREGFCCIFHITSSLCRNGLEIRRGYYCTRYFVTVGY